MNSPKCSLVSSAPYHTIIQYLETSWMLNRDDGEMGEVCVRVEGGGGGVQPQVFPGLLYKLTGQEASKRGLPQGPVKVKAFFMHCRDLYGSVSKCTKIDVHLFHSRV